MPAANCFQIKTDGSLNVVAKCGVSFAGGMAFAFHNKLQAEPIFMIELRAIEMALTTALDMGLSDIWIVSDSTNAVDIAEGQAASPWRARNILIRLQGLKMVFSRMKISHLWREANRAGRCQKVFGVGLWERMASQGPCSPIIASRFSAIQRKVKTGNTLSKTAQKKT